MGRGKDDSVSLGPIVVPTRGPPLPARDALRFSRDEVVHVLLVAAGSLGRPLIDQVAAIGAPVRLRVLASERELANLREMAFPLEALLERFPRGGAKPRPRAVLEE